ncbi:hypothetical protein [Baaleninema simplex]|uniref:hypothetical protein n=1 Tax=Baaleninema simplex TaxID=2862350 RepID=UPI00035DCD64|nr:hypothetical protein [Baaleninema simplex]
MRYSIEVANCLPAHEIEDAEEFINNVYATPPQRAEPKELLDVELIGYTTIIGGGLFICDLDMLWMSRRYSGGFSERNQIADSREGDAPGFCIGVALCLELQGIIPEKGVELPIYGEYKGNFLQRVIIENSPTGGTEVFSRLKTRQIQELGEAVRLEAAGDEGAETLLERLRTDLGDNFDLAYDALQHLMG